MKKDVLRGQCWPGLICHAICFVFTYSMFSPLFPSLHPWNVLACWNSHHTAPPAQRASLPAATPSSSTYTFLTPILECFCPLKIAYFPSAKIFMKLSTQKRRSFLFCTLTYEKEYFFSYSRRPFLSKPFFLMHSISYSIPFPCVWGEFPLYHFQV